MITKLKTTLVEAFTRHFKPTKELEYEIDEHAELTTVEAPASVPWSELEYGQVIRSQLSESTVFTYNLLDYSIHEAFVSRLRASNFKLYRVCIYDHYDIYLIELVCNCSMEELKAVLETDPKFEPILETIV